MWVVWTTVWWYQRMTRLSKLHFKWVSLFLTMCMATTVKLYRLVIVLHELFCSSIHVAASMNEALQTNMLEPLINHVYLLLWSCCLCTLKLIVASVDCTKNNITWTLSTLLKSPMQAADACARYPVTHYNLSLTRSSDVNQLILMLGPHASNDASRIETTLNSSDGIRQNFQYHFQISAVNIIGSSTSSGMEFCKSWIVLTRTCYHIIIPPVDAHMSFFLLCLQQYVLNNKSTYDTDKTHQE